MGGEGRGGEEQAACHAPEMGSRKNKDSRPLFLVSDPFCCRSGADTAVVQILRLSTLESKRLPTLFPPSIYSGPSVYPFRRP